ncbi:MAG: TetR/AcrR family transcriptional regulator [Clostridiales bacterium]|nr:TetR/AcrR family transcriptional regulator [Clostridiales bacterium]
MPKDTFFNLDGAKQRKIFEAAVDEFSQRRFSEASINQVVKNAKISRGSFYQYFDNKEDLYLYTLKQIGKEKLNIISRVGELKPDADFFDGYIYMFRAALEWSIEKPKYYRIGMLMELDDSRFVSELRKALPEGFSMLKGMVEKDIKLGRIRADVDPDLVVDIIYTLNLHILTRYYKADNKDELAKKVCEVIRIIKEGIANR